MARVHGTSPYRHAHGLTSRHRFRLAMTVKKGQCFSLWTSSKMATGRPVMSELYSGTTNVLCTRQR